MPPRGLPPSGAAALDALRAPRRCSSAILQRLVALGHDRQSAAAGPLGRFAASAFPVPHPRPRALLICPSPCADAQPAPKRDGSLAGLGRGVTVGRADEL